MLGQMLESCDVTDAACGPASASGAGTKAPTT